MLCFFFTLLGTLVLTECTELPELPEACRPRVQECPLASEAGPKCCNSSSNVKFYDPTSEPKCTAPPAIYEVSFTYTLTNACISEINNTGLSGWSQPSVFSHNSGYRLWDACMDDVSMGVDMFSTTGNRDGVTAEGVVAAVRSKAVLDAPIFDGSAVAGGTGETSIYITVDKNHPLVSTLTMLMSSPDQVVGVADLCLCDGEEWRKRVKVCFNELFSTSAASDRLAPEMERNSVQGNNCSFGFVEFNLTKTQIFEQRTQIAETCYPKVPDPCPRTDPIEACPTCCCESSDDIEFYNPDEEEPECTANPAIYEMKFTGTWSETCHPGDYNSHSVFSPMWSWPVGVSHNTNYSLWDACMDDVSVGVGLVSQIGVTDILVQEFAAAGSNIFNYTIGPNLLAPAGEVSQSLAVDKDHQFVSTISNRGPTPAQVVGVADLRLCDGEEWRKRVKVCFNELFSTAAASDRVAPEMERNSVQGNNCSFGYIEFNLLEPAGADTLTASTTIMLLVALAAASLGY